jgi:hypothetical protein
MKTQFCLLPITLVVLAKNGCCADLAASARGPEGDSTVRFRHTEARLISRKLGPALGQWLTRI